MNNPGLEVEVQPGVAVRQELFSKSEVKRRSGGWGFLEVAEPREPA